MQQIKKKAEQSAFLRYTISQKRRKSMVKTKNIGKNKFTNEKVG